MSLLKRIFESNNINHKKVLPWQALETISQLDEIVSYSDTKPQLIFKHSTRCGISKMVLNRFEDMYYLEADAHLYYLDLLSYRDLSNNVSSRFKVIHESPQLLMIKNGKVIVHANHGAINDLDLTTILI